MFFIFHHTTSVQLQYRHSRWTKWNLKSASGCFHGFSRCWSKLVRRIHQSATVWSSAFSSEKHIIITYIFNGRRQPFWNVRLIVQFNAPRTVTCLVYPTVTVAHLCTIKRTFWLYTIAQMQPSKGTIWKERKLFARFTRSAKSPSLNMTLPEMRRQLHVSLA